MTERTDVSELTTKVDPSTKIIRDVRLLRVDISR